MTNSFAMLNIVHSGLLKRLAGHYQIYIVSNFITKETLHVINKHLNISIQLLPLIIPREPLLFRFLRTIQKTAFFELHQMDTHRIKMLNWHWLIRALMTISRLVICTDSLKILLVDWVKKRIIQASPYMCKMTGSVPLPDGIISSSPLDIRENILVNCLRKRGVKSMGIVISWDNLTTKGMFNSHFDELLVWNDIMGIELRKYHQAFNPASSFRVTGNSRFDHYFKNQGKRPDSDPWNMRENRVILFATSPAKHVPAQSAIVQDLIAYAKTKKNVIIHVRCHPYDPPSNYDAFEGEKLFCVFSSTNNASHYSPAAIWIPSLDYLSVLQDQLLASNVCVQIASTFAIDAAACGKPVVNIAYDGLSVLPFKKSVRRFYCYTHQQTLSDLDWGHYVRSREELFTKLDEILFLKHPAVVPRSKVRELTAFTRPAATEATFRAIRQWLS